MVEYQTIQFIMADEVSLDAMETHRIKHHNMGKHFVSLARCEGNPPVVGGFVSQRASDAIRRYFHVANQV